MKAIGMFLIVLGHFFPKGNEYIYVFSVPVFFLISGFLSKKEKDIKTSLRKIWYNLFVPMILLSLISFAIMSTINLVKGEFSYTYLYQYPLAIILGMQGGIKCGGLGACWFVYTLIVLKIMIQITPPESQS
mgnify:CR=1 FL=1